MNRFYFLFLSLNIISGQILPTVPSNVFRFSIGTSLSESDWKLKEQNFNLRGIGRHYFDHLKHNDSVRFSSNYDLYHTGTVLLDSATTVEKWMMQFNNDQNYSLPTFGAQNIDTSKSHYPSGTFMENRKKNTFGKNLKIEYGMSNEITLSISIPFLDDYTIQQSIKDYSIGTIKDAQILTDYHINAKNELKAFRNSNSFNSLKKGLRDTLDLIYNLYYTNNGDYSVQWAFHSLDDPINNLLVNPRFAPAGINQDTVSLTDLISYYYPNQKNGKGIDDVTVGATILLKGKPSWSFKNMGNTLYGQCFVSIPYGQTLSSFLELVANIKQEGEDQFKQATIGNGVSRWSIGLYGSRELKTKRKSQTFFQTQIKFSTPATLNTPVALFSGGHTQPDSILSHIGNTYKYDQGNSFRFVTGGDIEFINNRLRLYGSIDWLSKGLDQYTSKDPEWDNWMEQHVGYSSTLSRLSLKAEIWILNSISKNRVGPFSFDLYAGLSTTPIVENTYKSSSVYSGITTYYQGW